MRRSLMVAVAVTSLCAGLATTPANAAATSRLATGTLGTGGVLTSPGGAFRATLTHGRLVVRDRTGRTRWASSRRATPATAAVLDRRGNLQLVRARHVYWSTRTSGAGSSVLRVGDDGVLSLRSGGLLVWSSRVLNACPHVRGKTFLVDISSQVARMCTSGRQVRATYVTTGASAKGAGTPTGRWRVYAKHRNTVLRPASGGSYPVRYWVPYDGAYGIHDSSWQKFAYGSGKYRTRGSHGCTHVPRRAMAWFYRWARVGTRVTIRR